MSQREYTCCCGINIGTVLWIANLIYAFMYWGFWHGLLNIFIPYALIWDLIVNVARVQ